MRSPRIAALPWLAVLFITLAVAGMSRAQSPELRPLSPPSGTPAAPQLGAVRAVAFHPEGGFLLLEDRNQRLLHYDRQGRFVGEAGGFGFGNGALRGATDVTAAGFEIWVADPFAGQIVRYDTWLAPLPPWTGALERGREAPFVLPVSAARAPSGDAAVIETDTPALWLLDPEGRLVERVGRFGELDRGFDDPRRIETGEDGSLAVADPGRGQALLFDRFGTPRGRRSWTGEGNGPVSVAWYGDRLWVLGESELKLLDPRGQTVREWSAEELGVGEGSTMRDIAVNSGSGQLLLAAGTTVHRFEIREAGGE